MTNTAQTTLQTIKVAISTLHGMACLASVKDIRYYLNGLYIEANSTHTRVVATDGKVLGAHDSEQENTLDKPVSFIMPIEIIKLVKASYKTLDGATIALNIDDTGLVLGGTIEPFGGTTIGFKTVEGKYPQYWRVIPSEPASGETAQFNPELVQKFVKTAKFMSSAKNPVPEIHHNGKNIAIIRFGVDAFVGVIMPMRTDLTPASAPTRFLTSLVA